MGGAVFPPCIFLVIPLRSWIKGIYLKFINISVFTTSKPVILTCSFLKTNFYWFIYFWLHWIFIALSSWGKWEPQVGVSLWCVGFSLLGFTCCGTQGLGVWASIVVAQGLRAQGLSSCGTWAHLPQGMWNLPRPGTGKSLCPELAGRVHWTTREVLLIGS